MGKYLFLDTNIYLHYKPVDELGLKRFGEGCTLVVPRVILEELNKHKDSHSSKTIRDRARNVCKSIHEWDDSKSVSDTLAFEFDIKTPSPQQHGLDPSSCDDRFLSGILEHPAPLADKVLLSNDSNLCLTAKHLGIVVDEIDECFKLTAELDPVEKEAHRLKRELDQLKNARPRLEIGLTVDGSPLDVEANPVFPLRPRKSGLSDEEIERQVEEVRSSLREKYTFFRPKTSLAMPLAMGISSKEISSYRQQLDGYPDIYRKYLQARRSFLRQPMFRFTIGIANAGTAPAQDVDIYLHFPDGFGLFEEKNIPSEPPEPPLPQKPMSEMERILKDPPGIRSFKMPTPQLDFLSSFSLKRTNSYDVSDSFHVIKHNERACVPELFLLFASMDAAKAFRCDYRVTVGNLPEEIKGSINFQFCPDEEGGA